MKLRFTWVSLVCVLAYLLIVGRTVLKGVLRTHFHFMYALDDAYIHMAVAEQIAHGSYGINEHEFSSPSSSILWPLLLAPFSSLRFFLYVPLAINVAVGAAAAWLIGCFVTAWPPRGSNGERMSGGKLMVVAVLLVLCSNLPGLTTLGMEHTIQIALIILCAMGVAEAFGGRHVPLWSVAAAVIAPSIRYEDLGVTCAVCFALIATGQTGVALGALLLSIVPLAAFSVFLHMHHLPLLPLSVLVKGNYASGDHLQNFIKSLVIAVERAFTDVERVPILVLTALFIGLGLTAENRKTRLVCAGVALAGAMHLLIGKFGWAHRYEVYILIFLLLLCFRVLHDRPNMLFGYLVFPLAVCAATYVKGTLEIPSAMADLYEQPFQTHRFVTEFYVGNYAVNDIGLVSFRKRPGMYVLDLDGLASLDAAQHQSDLSSTWLHSTAIAHDTPLAVITPGLMDLPKDWTPLAQMCNRGAPNWLASQCVLFVSTSASYTSQLTEELTRFSATLPKEDSFEVLIKSDGR